MMMQLQRYDMIIKYKKGTELYIADTLSRNYMNDPDQHQFEEVINQSDFEQSLANDNPLEYTNISE